MTSEPSQLRSRTTDDVLQPQTEPGKEDMGLEFNGNIHQVQSQLRLHPKIRPYGASRVIASSLARVFERIQLHTIQYLSLV